MVERITVLLFDDKYQKARWNAAFILYFLILALGSIPRARAELGQLASGLILHSLAYATITFLLFTGFNGSRLEKSLRAFFIVVLFGALDEFLQSFLSYRTGAVTDWLVDCAASFITIVLLLIFRPQESGSA